LPPKEIVSPIIEQLLKRAFSDNCLSAALNGLRQRAGADMLGAGAAKRNSRRRSKSRRGKGRRRQ